MRVQAFLSPAPFVYQRGNQCAPTRLMRSSYTRAVVAVKILVEQNVIAPVRIFLKFLRSAVHGATTRFISGEDANHTIGQLSGHLSQSHLAARVAGKRDAEMRAICRAEFS